MYTASVLPDDLINGIKVPHLRQQALQDTSDSLMSCDQTMTVEYAAFAGLAFMNGAFDRRAAWLLSLSRVSANARPDRTPLRRQDRLLDQLGEWDSDKRFCRNTQQLIDQEVRADHQQLIGIAGRQHVSSHQFGESGGTRSFSSS